MKPDIWEPQAEEEVDAAVAASAFPDEFRHAVAEAIRDIASGKIVHAAVTGTPCRRCILSRFPYSIIYVESTTEIRVFAFPHHKRRPGYWKPRLRKN